MACKRGKISSERKVVSLERYCGNCLHHNAYEYPHVVFCFKRLAAQLNPKVPTLWHCEEWTPSPQICFCVEEARKASAPNINQNESLKSMETK